MELELGSLRGHDAPDVAGAMNTHVGVTRRRYAAGSSRLTR